MRPDLLSTMTRRVLFAPLQDFGRADVVEDRLRTAITLGVLADGEQLPPESELAAQFNISPVTLREALAQLRNQGLVSTKRGRGGGTVVTAALVNQLQVAADDVRSLSTLDLRDLADLRRAIAAEAAWLAARRASSENMALLARECIRLAAAPDAVEARRADSRFLIELGAAAQSVRLSSTLVRLQVEYAPVLTLVYASAAIRPEIAHHFQDVMTAVREADGEAARLHVTAAVQQVAARAAELHSQDWRVA